MAFEIIKELFGMVTQVFDQGIRHPRGIVAIGHDARFGKILRKEVSQP
jgi:hypothetical protein